MAMPVEHRKVLHNLYVGGEIADYHRPDQVSVLDRPGERAYVVWLKVPSDG